VPSLVGVDVGCGMLVECGFRTFPYHL
jgi:hypothetical protein